MPTNKTHWTLNARKWFGTVSNSSQKIDKNNNNPSPPTATTIRTIPLTRTAISRLSTAKNKTKIIPVSNSNDANKNNSNLPTPITQFQLPAFSNRRERSSALLPSVTSMNRQTTFFPTHTEPTIRKRGRLEEELSIDTTRWNIQPTQTTIYDISKAHNLQQNPPRKRLDMSVSNMSHRCLIDYPRHSPSLLEESSFPTRSTSSSMVDDNDDSSSSGIFTDERQHTESKDTLSILEVRSIESIADSQSSLNHPHTRPIIHHYRRPMSVFETIHDEPQQRQKSLIRSHRSLSAEGILNDNQTISTAKSQQSSAAINKKLDKRNATGRSPTNALEKAGFVRITNDTYRLTVERFNHLSYPRQKSIDFHAPYSNCDDQLRSANNEECYALLPRTCSTEQLNKNNKQNDLRLIVDECIRPMVSSIGTNRLAKTNRYKRTGINNDHTQLSIDNITDKLLSSIDYSIYTQYQRCC